MMSLYRVAILIGLIPLGLLTVFTLTDYFNEENSTSAREDDPSSQDQDVVQDKATISKQSASVDLLLIDELHKATSDPYNSSITLESNSESFGKLFPVIGPWRDFIKYRTIAKEFVAVIPPVQPPPTIGTPPQHIDSIAEVQNLLSKFAREIDAAEDWLATWEVRYEDLKTLDERLMADHRQERTPASTIAEIAKARCNELESYVLEVKSRKLQFERATRSFKTIEPNYRLAKKLFDGRHYDEALEKLNACDPKPPEILKLAVLAEFRRDTDRLLARFMPTLSESYKQSWRMLEGDLKRVINEERFATISGTPDHERRAVLTDALEVLRARLEIHNMQHLDFEQWVARAKQIKVKILNANSSKTKISRTTSRQVPKGSAIVCDELASGFIGSTGWFWRGLSKPKKSVRLAGLQEAIMREGNVLYIGVFEEFTPQAYLYWPSVAAKKSPPQTIARGALSQLPRDPKPIDVVKKYNARFRTLLANYLSKQEWQQAHIEFQQLEKELDEYQDRHGGDRDGITFEDQIQFTEAVLRLWDDILFVLDNGDPRRDSLGMIQSETPL